jgi:hypothetical protein
LLLPPSPAAVPLRGIFETPPRAKSGMNNETQHGYLVLADISGYTAYLAGSELEHAHEILTDLLEVLVGQIRAVLDVSKLEGDAVFANAPEVKMPRGETLLELIESTYAAFRDRREAARRRTTCTCKACQNIPALDLKFFVHHGDYIIQNVSGIRELVGSDVNLAHRLMKNHIAENTGWRAYALLTEAGLNQMGVRPDGLHAQIESYEHLGEIQTYTFDLHPRYDALVQARRRFITSEQADLVITQNLSEPLTAVWDWINDPRKRIQWDDLDEVRPILRPGGRNGPGARNHCIHGKLVAVEDVLDWRPFDYFTIRICRQGFCIVRTCEFISIADGQQTRLHTNFFVEKMPLPLPGWLVRRLARPFLIHLGHATKTRDQMAQLVAKEAAELAEGVRE